jgi:phage terminase large subunit-like protein
MPEGQPTRLEPFWRAILRVVFRTGLVEILVLLPKGNGKTAILAALAVYHLLVTPNAQCFVAAADVEQADELYRFAQHYVQAHGLERYLKVGESTRKIRSRRDQGFLRVLASDKTKQQGKKHSYNPTLAIIEELHAHENDANYTAMRTAAFKRGGIVVDISTAGWDEENSTLGQLRAGMLALDQDGGTVRRGLKVDGRGRMVEAEDGRLTVCESKSRRTVMFEWACRETDDLNDPAVVKLANPASWVTVDSIEDAREAPGITPWKFMRYRANIWTLAFESWLPAKDWDRWGVPFDPDCYRWDDAGRRRTAIVAPSRLGVVEGDDVFAFVDMGRYRDSAAIVVVAPKARACWLAFVEKPAGERDPVPYGPIEQAARELDDRYRMLALGYDPKYFDKSAEDLHDEGLPMHKFPQSNERMGPAWGNLYAAVVGPDAVGVRHDSDPVLRAHLLAGAAKDIGDDAFKVVKSSHNGPPIDAAVALAGAHQLAFFRPAPVRPSIEVLA